LLARFVADLFSVLKLSSLSAEAGLLHLRVVCVWGNAEDLRFVRRIFKLARQSGSFFIPSCSPSYPIPHRPASRKLPHDNI